ncbi:hypothetical protein FOBRF1_007335 [Fusarium oxysporum]
MAETTRNTGGLTAPPNSPTQRATTPPSCDEIQSSPRTAPIPATWMRERLEDGRPQSRSFAPVPSLCQPVTLDDNNIALSRGNNGHQDDDETRYASVTLSLKDDLPPNNSPPLNHLLIRFNQNALLACGLSNHSMPSNVFPLWDVQCLNQYGVEVYTSSLLAYIESSTSKPRKRYDSGAQWLELRLHDLQAHLQLRDYAVLEAEFSDRQTPEGPFTSRASSIAAPIPYLQHHLFLLTFDNKLGLAPPNLPGSKVERVLDVGTGTGIWAIDFADDHPEAEVLGIDLSPIQPSFVPANVEFQIDDIDEEWNYSAPFTYIHSRMMNMSIQNWEDYLRKIFDNLTPGGYVELQDGDAVMESDDGTLTKEHALSKWCNLLREASDKLGRPCIPTKELRNIMGKVGFTNIVETRFKWPSNCWPKDKKIQGARSVEQ